MLEGAGVAAAEACMLGVLWYGGTRLVSQVTKELQYPLFAPVGQVRSVPVLRAAFLAHAHALQSRSRHCPSHRPNSSLRLGAT